VIAVATGVFGVGLAGLAVCHTICTSVVQLVMSGFAMVV
jgi:hypothetical protein